MITAQGCRDRCQRLLERLKPSEPLVLGDPLHLRYFAGLYVDPFSLGGDYGGILHISPDGKSALHYDHRIPKPSAQQAHADEKKAIDWYDGKHSGRGPRRTILLDAIGPGGRIHDDLSDPLAKDLFAIIADLRRSKDPDEVEVFRQSCRIAEAGQAWALRNVVAGMTELDVYNGIFAACSRKAGQPVVVYGDFAVSPGSSRRGGPPTQQVLATGDMLILDFSVVLQGYRCDFTNTLVVGGSPTPDQVHLYDACRQAMTAGEQALRAGAHSRDVYAVVKAALANHQLDQAFPHHAGHGLGLSHPEAPFLVEQSEDTLRAGDIVTLEPGVYVDGIGGIRIEHNYLITETGFEQLSQHEITLV